MLKRTILTAIITLNLFFVYPCGWDYDTMKMEKEAFPSVHELIVGRFLKHSTEFYYWRVKDREEQLIDHPDSLELYNDLAWAYDKIGNSQKAIEVMLEKDKLDPGLYKTYANLGTSYLHNGEIEEGIKYIKKAIEINPEAHFGREVYQQYLAEYLISKTDSTEAATLPLGKPSDNFYHYIKEIHFKEAISNGSSSEAELAKAIKGLAGMLRFGSYGSPLLLEALADLLVQVDLGVDKGAGHLASRAYMKAALESGQGDAYKAYKRKAKEAIERNWADHHRRPGSEPKLAHRSISVENLELIVKLETQSAIEWTNEIRANELQWIEAGVNPDSAFSATYYDVPVQKPIQKYFAKKNIDEIQEEFWLNKQLNKINLIGQIHEEMSLSDSSKQWLDSIYELEFAWHEAVSDTIATIDPEEGVSGQSEKGSKMSFWMIVLMAAAGMLLVVFVVNRTKKKQD